MVEYHIRKAISVCEDDDGRRYLYAALSLADKSAKKEKKRTQSKVYAEEAKKKNTKWQEMLNKIKIEDKKSDEKPNN